MTNRPYVPERAGVHPEDAPTSLLVQRIANKYDDRLPYAAEWRELVRRVGEEEAERLVDQAP